ncbi:TPA: hypothetical protein ACGUT0_002299, partial [Vibrio vulnificus]
MATVESENKGWNEQDLNELFSTIDVNKIKKPFSEYLNAIDSLYSMYQADSNSWLMRHFQQFDTSDLDEKSLAFVSESLSIANYDSNSLQGEQVILFREPVLVSELYCSKPVFNDGTDAVRIISHLGFDKKVVTDRVSVHKNNPNKPSTAYQIHDSVRGLILPRNLTFHSIKLVTLKKLLTDSDKIEAVQKALKNAQEAPAIEVEKISKKLVDINMILRSESERMDALQSEIQLREQQQQHLDNTLANTEKSLTKVQKDLDKANLSYQKISSELSEKEDQIEDIEGKTEA